MEIRIYGKYYQVIMKKKKPLSILVIKHRYAKDVCRNLLILALSLSNLFKILKTQMYELTKDTLKTTAILSPHRPHC